MWLMENPSIGFDVWLDDCCSPEYAKWFLASKPTTDCVCTCVCVLLTEIFCDARWNCILLAGFFSVAYFVNDFSVTEKLNQRTEQIVH